MRSPGEAAVSHCNWVLIHPIDCSAPCGPSEVRLMTGSGWLKDESHSLHLKRTKVCARSRRPHRQALSAGCRPPVWSCSRGSATEWAPPWSTFRRTASLRPTEAALRQMPAASSVRPACPSVPHIARSRCSASGSRHRRKTLEHSKERSIAAASASVAHSSLGGCLPEGSVSDCLLAGSAARSGSSAAF